MEDSELRIGVFVCHCGVNIGGIVDVPEVVQYAMELDNVVYSEENLYTCSSDGLNKLKEGIIEHNLNRVVVASCTPRTHEPLFQSACEEAGLNNYLFEMANIRDQCSWVHMHQPEAATEKAKDLVGMAVAKARLLEPQEEPEIEIKPTSLVIGGGISGMTAALSLAEQGFEVHIIEKEGELGGMLLNLGKLFPSNRNSRELIHEIIERVSNEPNIQIHTGTEIREVKGFIGDFDVKLVTQGEPEELSVGTIIVATGAELYEPEGLYGYGQIDRIVTQLQLEESLHKQDLEYAKTIVMIQCVGSRCDAHPYCSRICCSEALKNALLLKKSDPGREVYILYRDLQTYGTHYSDMEWDAKKSNVKLIKYDKGRPPEVSIDEAIKVHLYSPLIEDHLDIDADLLVLSTPLIPAHDTKKLSQLLKVPLNSDGFFMEAHVKLRPLDFATDGIYVCGTAHSPKEVGESISQALGAASRAAIPMARQKIKTPAITSVVDEDRCSGCGTCIELCPYNAITKNDEGIAEVTSAICKGCGVCSASCPERAITMKHFTNEELLAQGIAALRGGN
jgi:heterodisulfide reductase subunit A